MRLIKTALFVFGLAGVFFITGNSLAHNTMHKHGQNMMGMQNQDSTAVMPGNSMMQSNTQTMHHQGHMMMNTQNQDSTAVMPGNSMMRSNTQTMHHQGNMMMNMQNQDSTAVMPGNQMMQTNQTLCPVTGNKIDKKTYVDYKGQRVYFCCQSCVAAFKKNPDKYIKSMNEKGIRLEKTPAKISTESKSEKSGS